MPKLCLEHCLRNQAGDQRRGVACIEPSSLSTRARQSSSDDWCATGGCTIAHRSSATRLEPLGRGAGKDAGRNAGRCRDERRRSRFKPRQTRHFAAQALPAITDGVSSAGV